jgi:pimeloyl-ACP methyl ester carboxylesterase
VWSESAGDPHAPLAVLIHGSMDRSAGLLKLSRRLDDTYHVVRYDRRGYGRSRPHPGPFRMADQVDDLASLVDDDSAVLIGHSYGGNVALAFAARRPDVVRAIVVYETPLSWLEWWPGTTAGGSALTEGDPADAAERFMRRLVGDHRWDRLPQRTRTARREEGHVMLDELTDLRSHAPWSADRLAVPLLVLHGQRGAEHHRAGAEALTRMIAGAESLEIEDAAHFGPNTHPDEVAAVIKDFIDRRATV